MVVQRGGEATKTLWDMARENNGCLTSAQMTAASIPRRLLSDAVEAGRLVQVERGLHALPDAWEDPYLVADEVLGLGLVKVRTMYGNVVRAYDMERTLCDVVRGQRFVDEQVVNPAMRTYVRRCDKNIPKLLSYARELGVEGKIHTYVRILL